MGVARTQLYPTLKTWHYNLIFVKLIKAQAMQMFMKIAQLHIDT